MVSESKEPDGTPVQEVVHRKTGDTLFRIEHYLDMHEQPGDAA